MSPHRETPQPRNRPRKSLSDELVTFAMVSLQRPNPRGALSLSLDHHDERLPFFDDIRGEMILPFESSTRI